MNHSKYKLNNIHFVGIGGSGMSGIAEVLNNLAKQYPIAEKIVTYRHYSKLLSTYVE